MKTLIKMLVLSASIVMTGCVLSDVNKNLLFTATGLIVLGSITGIVSFVTCTTKDHADAINESRKRRNHE